MGILPSCRHVSTTVWLHHLDFNEMFGDKKARWEVHKGAECCFEQNLNAAPYWTAVAQPFISHLEQNMLGTAEEVRTNSLVTFSAGLLHMDIPVLAD